MSMKRMATLRQILVEEPSWELWNQLVAFLDEWPQDDSRLLAMEYVQSHLDASWPDELRLGHHPWSKTSAGWQLCRAKPLPMTDLPDFAMVLCPSGTFRVGAVEDEYAWEAEEFAQEEVVLTRPFWYQKTMVTQGQWKALMGRNPSLFSHSDKHPVDRVNWYQAVAFCNVLSRQEGLEPAYSISGSGKVTLHPEQELEVLMEVDPGVLYVDWKGLDCEGYRLPTEAEWEVASRAGCLDSFYAETPETCGWMDTNSRDCTEEVGKLESNAWGLYDVVGNLWEWCQDSVSSDVDEVQADYFRGGHVDPVHYDSLDANRWLRGGAWIQSVSDSKLSSRVVDSAYVADEYAGFRVCRTAKKK